MASQIDFKTIRIQEGEEAKAISAINAEIDNGYFPVGVIDNEGESKVTTILLSQGLSVIQQPEPDSSNVHVDVPDNTASQDIILIDLDDTATYPHRNTGLLNIENVAIDVDSGSTADWIITLGFLKNVDGTDGEFVQVYKLSGNKTKGSTKQLNVNFFPNGGKMTPERWMSSTVVNDVAFANTNQLVTTADLGTADTNPGDGDLVMRIQRNDTGAVNFSLSFSYHSKI